MNLITTKTIGGHEVRQGLRIPYPSNHERVTFAISVVCESELPETWHGEVALMGHKILETPAVGSHDTAGRAAEKALVEAVLRAFAP